MLCPYCRNPLPETAPRFCTACGGDLQVAPPLPADHGAPQPPPQARRVEADEEQPGVSPETGANGIAWDRREQLGLATAFIETTKAVLAEPTDFFTRLPKGGGLGGPLLYGTLTGYIGLLANTLYQVVLGLIQGPPPEGGTPMEQLVAGLRGGMPLWQGALMVVLGPVVVVLGLLVGAAVWHVCLMMVGGAREDFEATLRVACFVNATALLQVVPFCGGIVAPFYGLGVGILGLARAHEIPIGRAALAVLGPLLLCCCCISVLGFFFAASLASLLNR